MESYTQTIVRNPNLSPELIAALEEQEHLIHVYTPRSNIGVHTENITYISTSAISEEMGTDDVDSVLYKGNLNRTDKETLRQLLYERADILEINRNYPLTYTKQLEDMTDEELIAHEVNSPISEGEHTSGLRKELAIRLQRKLSGKRLD